MSIYIPGARPGYYGKPEIAAFGFNDLQIRIIQPKLVWDPQGIGGLVEIILVGDQGDAGIPSSIKDDRTLPERFSV